MDTQRLILAGIFVFSLFLLWDAWEKENRPKPPAAAAIPAAPEQRAKSVAEVASTPSRLQSAAPAGVPGAAEAQQGEILRVTTDVLVAEIDTRGGTLRKVELLHHKDAVDVSKNFVLLEPEHGYSAQSGLTGDAGPNHRTLWRAAPGDRVLAPGQDSLQLRLAAEGSDGLAAEKIYTFRRDSYLIDVALEIRNAGTATLAPFAYFQLTHGGKTPDGGSSFAQSFGAQSFTGFAQFTDEKKYEKIPLPDLDKGKAQYVRRAGDGWIAFVQHYFVSAWIAPENAVRDFVVEKRADGLYAGRIVLSAPSLAPGGRARLSATLYAGPQEQRRLESAARGLDLVVDYGWLAIIAWPLFWLLEKCHALSGNWGLAIILLTVVVKLAFFPLSAASYKSMAKMKLVTPRLTKIREMYEHDRAKMNQAMMELYRTEKINPLGGCFPILVQIPVFIALYWVLLAAIELRHAPFVLWIKDLSALDPYYVLPLLMTATMVLQTKMNPTPPDPVQAKVMTFMPFVFSIFFFFFPAGLVLYWLVNNILSILQQWQIQRMFDRGRSAHAKR